MVSYITVLVGHGGAGVELVREAQDQEDRSLPLSGRYVLLYIHLYQFFSFLPTVAKTCGRNSRQFQKVQAVRTDCSWACSGACGEWLLFCTVSEEELSTDLCLV